MNLTIWSAFAAPAALFPDQQAAMRRESGCETILPAQ